MSCCRISAAVSSLFTHESGHTLTKRSPSVCAQGRLQDGQCAEERGLQEVRLQWHPAAQLPQTVPPSRRQLQILTAQPHSVQTFSVKMFISSCKVNLFLCHQ